MTYAYMPAADLAGWIAIATFAGFLTRKIVRTPMMAGLFGDLIVGLLGAFGLGWVLQQMQVDPTALILQHTGGVEFGAALWVDVVLVAFVGSLLIRLAMKPLTEFQTQS